MIETDSKPKLMDIPVYLDNANDCLHRAIESLESCSANLNNAACALPECKGKDEIEELAEYVKANIEMVTITAVKLSAAVEVSE